MQNTKRNNFQFNPVVTRTKRFHDHTTNEREATRGESSLRQKSARDDLFLSATAEIAHLVRHGRLMPPYSPWLTCSLVIFRKGCVIPSLAATAFHGTPPEDIEVMSNFMIGLLDRQSSELTEGHPLPFVLMLFNCRRRIDKVRAEGR